MTWPGRNLKEGWSGGSGGNVQIGIGSRGCVMGGCDPAEGGRNHDAGGRGRDVGGRECDVGSWDCNMGSGW